MIKHCLIVNVGEYVGNHIREIDAAVCGNCDYYNDEYQKTAEEFEKNYPGMSEKIAECTEEQYHEHGCNTFYFSNTTTSANVLQCNFREVPTKEVLDFMVERLVEYGVAAIQHKIDTITEVSELLYAK